MLRSLLTAPKYLGLVNRSLAQLKNASPLAATLTL